MTDHQLKTGMLRRSLKTSITRLARALWRGGARPAINMLPKQWGARLLTLAHYSKVTLIHGETLDFSARPQISFEGWPDRTPESTPSAYGEQSDNHTDVITAQETAEAPSKPSKKPPPQILPDWIIGELGKLAEIEPELTPTSALIDAYHVYHTPVALEPARVYAQCANVLAQGKPDLVILVPYLTRGGADLGVLHHVNAAITSGMNVAVIATMNLDSPWKSKLPPNCPFIEYGKLATKLDAHQIRTVLARLLIDSPAQVIHIVNSYLAWEVLQRNGKSLVSTGKRVYASVFSDGRDANGVMWSYPRFFFTDCWRYLSGVISDSRWYPEDLVRQYGVPHNKLYTIYFPAPTHKMVIYRAKPGGKILWASRITASKRPDLLAKIAHALPEIEFDVFGYAADKEDFRLEKLLTRAPNIRMRGKYESIDEIVQNGAYSAFLYTTAWDGLPNVLLEATAAGLPVVASALCGIPEFIDETTGYPVSAAEEVGCYVARIREILDSPNLARKKWEAACDRIDRQHSPARFAESLSNVPGYLKSGMSKSEQAPQDVSAMP